MKWFENYFTYRQQFVFINGSSSNLLSILFGVPQGTILGPLLFLVYRNNLTLCCELFSFLFVDDTTLLASKSKLADLFSFVNEEFHKVVYSFRAHKLVLLPDKTMFMLFTNSNLTDLSEKVLWTPAYTPG
jgi:hypothetical protein